MATAPRTQIEPAMTSDTTQEVLDLMAEWQAIFGEPMPWGFEVGENEIPILRQCIKQKSQQPIEDFVRSLPTDRTY